MQETFGELRTKWVGRFRLTGPALLAFCLAAMLHAQSFPSGSTGADGDLIVNTGVTTFTATPAGGGSVYNFKTIQIAPGSTLKLSGAVFPGPLYFLASGAVTISGTIDLSGQNGSVPTTPAQRTGPTVPGPGGYGGGAASFAGNPAQPGLGPSGGAVSAYCSSYSGYYTGGGGFNGNQFLVPLVGGSGGGGNTGSGGAGGGALLIASSVSITVNGTITANGGNGVTNSGGGAGGGVRLVAPTIAGDGAITTAGGNGAGSPYCGNGGASGTVRLEFFQNTFTGSTSGTLYLANPFSLFIPSSTAQPSLMVTSIGGVAVPPNPTGSFVVPDAIVSSSSPLTVNIQASNIPLGTVPTVYFSTENFPDQKITANAGLTGTLSSSSTTATVTLNSGYSIGYLTATWVQ
jgi:hypothetical protein